MLPEIHLTTVFDAAICAQVGEWQQKLDLQRWSVESLKHLFENPKSRAFLSYINIKEKHTVAGFCLVTAVGQEAEIFSLAVAPALQHQGVGGHLLQHMLNILKASDINHVFLEVAVTNKPAQRLYDSCGFNQIGLRPGYYGPSKEGDARVLGKNI